MTHVKSKNLENLYFKYGILFLFSLHLLFAKDEQGRVLRQITLNLELERFTVVLLISMMLYVLLKVFSNLRLDVVSLLLFARVVYSLSSLINYEGTIVEFVEAGYFQLVFLSVLYVLIINTNDKEIESKVVWIFKIVYTVMLLQIYYVFINAISKGVSPTSVKSWITIPMGRSNFIAMMVAFLLVFFFVYMKKSVKKTVLLSLLFGALVITSSDGALLSISFVMLIYYIDKIKNRYLKYIVVISILILVVLAFTIPVEIGGNTSSANITIQDRIGNILEWNFKQASSGRIGIYAEYLKQVMNNPIFGNGFYKPFVKIQGNAHNFLLQEAYNAGVISLLILIFVLVSLMNKFKGYMNKDIFVKATYYSTFYVIIQSLIEPGLLGYKIGFYFWLIVGASVLQIRQIKEQKE